jgi:hypothetical protein
MAVVKTVSGRGQIALGKKYAGRQVVVEELEPGVWILKVGRMIPDSELWLHTPEVQERVDEALQWAAQTPPQETDLDELEERVLGGPHARLRATGS